MNIRRQHTLLDNGCKLFIKDEKDKCDELYNGIEIPEELYQPGRRDGSISKVMGFTGKYPKIWPFDGPKADWNRSSSKKYVLGELSLMDSQGQS